MHHIEVDQSIKVEQTRHHTEARSGSNVRGSSTVLLRNNKKTGGCLYQGTRSQAHIPE